MFLIVTTCKKHNNKSLATYILHPIYLDCINVLTDCTTVQTILLCNSKLTVAYHIKVNLAGRSIKGLLSSGVCDSITKLIIQHSEH